MTGSIPTWRFKRSAGSRPRWRLWRLGLLQLGLFVLFPLGYWSRPDAAGRAQLGSLLPALHPSSFGGRSLASEILPKIEHRVSFRGEDVSLREVLQSFADQAGVELDLQPEVDGRLSLELRGARLRSVMTDLCFAYRCAWKLDATGRLSVASLPEAH